MRGKLMKDLKIEPVLCSAGKELLVSVGAAKLEGEPLVITVTRATSLERPASFESASTGGSGELLSGAEPNGWPAAFQTARRIVRGRCGRWDPASQLEQDPVQPGPQQPGQRQRPVREHQAGKLSQQRTDLGADFNRGSCECLECREDRRYSNS
jgi:hypothetical protein